MLAELEGAGHQLRLGSEEHCAEACVIERTGDARRDALEVELLEDRLVVKGVHLGRSAHHVEEDDGLRLGRKVWLARQERIDRINHGVP